MKPVRAFATGLGVLGLVAITASCASQPETIPNVLPRTAGAPIQTVKGIPCWVTDKGKCLSGDRKVFYGVGNAAGVVNPSLLRKSAEAFARQDIGRTMEVYQAELFKAYQRSVTAGAMDRQSEEQLVQNMLKQVTQTTLRGAEIVQYWEHPQRNEAYALAQLDLERFLETLQAYKSAAEQVRELDAKVRDAIIKNADQAYDELNRELRQGQK